MHKEKAMNLFSEGYNCSQAVFMSFCDELGIEKDTAAKLASSFGGGMGRMREVCGAVSGMIMAAGMLYGYSNPNDREAKTEHYARVQKLAESFKAENGSIICRELLGLERGENSGSEPTERTAEFYKKRPCRELVGAAAQILEDYMKTAL